MRKQHLALVLLASLPAVSATAAQTLDWDAVKKLSPRTYIAVTTQKETKCDFQMASNDLLYCHTNPEDWLSYFSRRYYEWRQVDLAFKRADIRQVRVMPFDYSEGPLSLLLAAGGGGGLDYTHQPAGFAGVKVGGPVSLDLQYDRIQGQNGFSTEGSAVVPLFRVPRFNRDKDLKFLKVYAEPGLGYRAGGGAFGGYSSAKVLVVLLSDSWSGDWGAPYVEFQRRFPFGSPLQGDTRLTFGVMLGLCEHCGLN